MAHSTLPSLSSPAFPQAALDQFVERIFARPSLGTCDFENEFVCCREAATVHDLGLEQEFCVRHFIRLVKDGF